METEQPKPNNKQRLDQFLVENAYFDSREKARTAIMSNYVKIKGQVVHKPGTLIKVKELEENPDLLEIEQKFCPYVSRGAFKLEEAKEKFAIDFKNKIVLDLGASTGGFTDYALQHGAKKVIAVDVGKGQLDYKLRSNPKVRVLDDTNVRHLQFSELKPTLFIDEEYSYYQNKERIYPIDIVLADLSFISLVTVIDNVKKLIEDNYHGALSRDRGSKASKYNVQFIFLIKPQFEAGKEIADKFRGIISDAKIREKIVQETVVKITEKGFILKGLAESPIKGAKGNVEYLAYFKLKESTNE